MAWMRTTFLSWCTPPAPLGTLHGHVARNNPVWHDFSGDVQVLVIFQGPEAYVSPSWYASKKEHGKVVPTWNYLVVHVHGHMRVIDDPVWMRAHLEALVSQHESERPVPWSVTDAPADYVEKMIKGIVGLEIRITHLVGKWKLSQNRSVPDREGVVEGLTWEAAEQAQELAELMLRAI